MLSAHGFCDHGYTRFAQGQSAGRDVSFPDVDRAGSEQVGEHPGSTHQAGNQPLR
jgi:hypothetical protein